MTHELKTEPPYFELIRTHQKTFEVRRNDRKFKVGDVLQLKEFIPATVMHRKDEGFTGRELSALVTLIYQGKGIDPDYVVMQIALVQNQIAPKEDF
jgi:hypothetical protein